MLITCWSVKGGAGVSVVSAALATLMVQRHGAAALVDLGGDQPGVLGVAEPGSPGVGDWCASEAPGSALSRLCLPVAEGLVLLPRGDTVPTIDGRRAEELVAGLHDLAPAVVIDAGLPLTSPPAIDGHHRRSAGLGLADPVRSGHLGDDLAEAGPGDPVHLDPAMRPDRCRPPAEFLRAAGNSLFVTRACYLALRRAMAIGIDADGVVLVGDPGRSLDRRDVAGALGLPVVGVVEADPAVSRAVDSGVLLRHLPRVLSKGLRGAG